jgi:hypothetical protein
VIALALFATLCGAVLAFRFKVHALYPAILVSAALVCGFGITAGLGFWATLMAAAVTATAMQLGYLFGILARYALVSARVSARRRRMDARRAQAI